MSSYDRRRFMRAAAAAPMTVTAAPWITNAAGSVATDPTAEAPKPVHFQSQWHRLPDRVWVGQEYWSNPLQDWRIAQGRLECIQAAPDRHVHVLTVQLGAHAGGFETSVRVGPLSGEIGDNGKGTAGFRIGCRGPLGDYRNNLLFGRGIDAGITGEGKLYIGDPSNGVVSVNPDDVRAVELRLAATLVGERYLLELTAVDEGTKKILATVQRADVPPEELVGNIALTVNGHLRAVPRPAARVQAKARNSLGTYWFADWRIRGDKFRLSPSHEFGPILFSQYTFSDGVCTLTAQMPPIGDQDCQTVRLQVGKEGGWQDLAESSIHPQARTATFRMESWDASKDTDYRLVYPVRFTDGSSLDHEWTGVIRRDPVDQPVLTVADISCNGHMAFPNIDYVARVARLKPDLLAFTGDQFYESSGGYGVQRAPLAESILDLLRKWYLHGWTWRELTRSLPSISIPDDHDVYQGNIWGEGGEPRRGTQEMGGYDMPPEWVNVVHRTQTSHHPLAYDPSPQKQGIHIYYGSLTYGRVSFAILADREFKSGPEGKVPPTGDRGDHVVDPKFDPKTADLPGLELLGKKQIEFLKQWVSDWRGADMKGVISQTIFTAMATTHGFKRERLIADYDANGWPQTARHDALREIRKAFAFHIAGDQHLPAIVHYGIDAPGDAGLALAGPPVNCIYPRWFEPDTPGGNREQGAPENTGEFVDSFGNPMTVLAVANPKFTFRSNVLEAEQDKASGFAVIRFHKVSREIRVECWPYLADPEKEGTQFPGWPRTISQRENYGRVSAGYLPTLHFAENRDPLVQLFDATGTLIYNLRVADSTFQPHVFEPGVYHLKVLDPETGSSLEFRDLQAETENRATIEVVF
ncbi:MAG: alkaline phosphatase D family protein [Planctomycetota bacterium]